MTITHGRKVMPTHNYAKLKDIQTILLLGGGGGGGGVLSVF